MSQNFTLLAPKGFSPKYFFVVCVHGNFNICRFDENMN